MRSGSISGAFDSLNFPRYRLRFAWVLMDAQDADDTHNFASDAVSGFNVNSIAIEVPISMLTRTGTKVAATNPAATIGSWGVTSRQRVRVLPGTPGREAQTQGPWVQIQRMANPLFNELIIGTGYKDKFSMSEPKDDAQFASFALDPVLARVLNAVYGIPVPDAPRTACFRQYVPPLHSWNSGPVADLLRLNTGVPPTAASARSVWACWLAMEPASRTGVVSDDVTGIAARAWLGSWPAEPFRFRTTALGRCQRQR
jgi:hypothetical protein